MSEIKKNSKNYSSLDFWYLDWIELKDNATPIGLDGKYLRRIFEKMEGPISAFTFDNDERLWVVRPEIREIQASESPNEPAKTIFYWSEEENIIDIEFDNNEKKLYLLDSQRDCIYTFGITTSLPDEPIRLRSDRLEELSLKPFKIGTDSRMALWFQTQRPYVFISLPNHSGIIATPLWEKGVAQAKKIKINWSSGIPDGTQVGAPCGMCVDEKANSLLIADSMAHRVFELKIIEDEKNSTQLFTKANLICGGALPGNTGDGGKPIDGRLNKPMDIQVYRYLDYIGAKLISKKMLQAIVSDPEGVLPRCIYVADSGNHCIRKIVQIKEKEILLTLVGITSGEISNEEIKLVIERPPRLVFPPERNLLKVQLYFPHRIKISPKGKFAFINKQSTAVDILYPMELFSRPMNSMAGT
jgi:hypothetical protein